MIFKHSPAFWNKIGTLIKPLTNAINVAIGRTTSTAKLSVQSDGTNDILNLFETGGTEVMTVLENGNVGIGTSNPSVKFHVTGDGASVAAGLLSGTNPTILISGQAKNVINAVMVASNSSIQRPIFRLDRARGTITTPLAVANNDYLGDFLFGGYDGAAVQYGGGLFAFVDGTVSSGNVPLRLSFMTGTNGTNRAERLVVKSDGSVGIGITSPTAKLDVNSDIFRLRTAKTPATAGASGNAGDICWDSGFVYVCVATNTWKRSALATW